MKKRPCFSFRPRLEDAEQRKAWEILQAVPEGQRTAFVVRSLLQSTERDVLEQTLLRVLKEEMRGIQIQPSAEEKAVPSQMLDFLAGL